MVQSWRRALSTAPLRYSDDYLREILGSVKTIAVVGASTDWRRPSNFAMKYLQHKGWRASWSKNWAKLLVRGNSPCNVKICHRKQFHEVIAHSAVAFPSV